jgi:hypothetical protein
MTCVRKDNGSLVCWKAAKFTGRTYTMVVIRILANTL